MTVLLKIEGEHITMLFEVAWTCNRGWIGTS